jgi:ribulose kinase
MENITPAIVLGAILAVAGGISTLGNAANWLVKLVSVFKAPNAEQNKQLAELQEWRKGVDQKLDNDNRRLNRNEDSERITQRALLALLAHGIDGNHQKQMEEAKEELQNHLISK